MLISAHSSTILVLNKEMGLKIKQLIRLTVLCYLLNSYIRVT